MTETTTVTESPELTEFKRKVWIVAQRAIHTHGERDSIQDLLEELGVQDSGFSVTEPEAEGLYRIEGGDQETLLVKAVSSHYHSGSCWFMTKAHTPRSTGYQPQTFQAILGSLLHDGVLTAENNYTITLVKA